MDSATTPAASGTALTPGAARPSDAPRAPESAHAESPSRRSLPNHEALSGTTIHGGAAAFFGLPFLAAGVFITLLGTGVVSLPRARIPDERAVVVVAGSLFGMAGLWLVTHGVGGMLRHRRAAAMAVKFPDAPWRYDRTWRRDGENARRWKALARPALGTFFFGAFAAVPATLGFGQPGAPSIFRIVAVVMIGLTMLPAWQLVRRVLQTLRYGRTYVRWDKFPEFVGETVTLRFGVTRSEPDFGRLVLRLRCVEEAYELTSSGRNRSQTVVCYALHEEERVLTQARDLPRPNVDAVAHFTLPAGLPGNDLLARPGRWWELEVEGEAHGLDYRERFLLPVYVRPESYETGGATPRA